MKVHIHLNVGDLAIDQTVEGDSAEAVVGTVRGCAAAKAGLLIGAFIRRMTSIEFAREATRRYNAASGANAPMPATCDEFLSMAVAHGLATVDGDAARERV